MKRSSFFKKQKSGISLKARVQWHRDRTGVRMEDFYNYGEK